MIKKNLIGLPPFGKVYPFLFLILISLPPSVYPTPGALIVVGLSGDNRITEQYRDMSRRTAEALHERGIPREGIRVLSDRVMRQDILAALDQQLGTVEPHEEFWLLLLGHGGLGRDGEPLFQVRGPRLKATDLQKALLKHPNVRVIIVLGFDRSGGFIPHLETLDTLAITATSSKDERSLPRFTGYLVDALEESPKAGVALLAARAAERTKNYYERNHLARGEESRLYDPDTGKIMQPPFGVSDFQEEPKKASRHNETLKGISASEINIPKSSSEALFTESPATDETRALIAEARKVPNPDGFAGLLLRREIELTVTPTYQSTRRERLRVYLATAAAFDQWANYHFPVDPPLRISRIEAARLILPDGRSRVMGTTRDSGGDPTMPSVNQLYVPGVEPGSIIELEFVTESLARQDIPAYYIEIPLQLGLPTLSSHLTLNLPSDERFHFYLANLETEPVVVEREQSRIYTWELKNLPAYEPLPYDPDRREWTAWLGVSSIPSWEGFTTWFTRIAEGAFDSNDEVIALAADISTRHPEREARIRAAYEYVTALRYIAIEIGIQAFRPRTPGQVLAQGYGDCKDKANLLTALLREMDIPAHIALINRFSFTELKFPGWQFNHAIAYLEPSQAHPQGLWLDATETTTPYGELAPGNAGRQALIVDEFGKGVFRAVQPRSQIDKVESWTLKPGESAWSALYTRPMDNSLHRQLIGKSPRQRNLFLRALTESLSPRSDIQSATIQEDADHGNQEIIRADVSLVEGVLPRPDIPWQDAFLAPTRDRPLQLVEAPTRYTQLISMPANAMKSLPAGFQNTEGRDHIDCRITWSRSAQGGILRTATIEIRQPVSSPESYPAIRQAFSEWWRHLHYKLGSPS